MEVTYELWDVGAGNIIGSFATEDEGLDIVRTLLTTYGRGYAAELSFVCRDGTTPARQVAIGDQLAELAERRAAERAGSASAVPS